jgi:hypothetical protein
MVLGVSTGEVVTAFFVGLGIPALLGWWWWRSTRPKPEGATRCTQCGYDLRSTPLRCPECGLVTRQGRRRQLKRLQTEWPANAIAPRTPRADETPSIVYSTDDGGVADYLRQHLEARGIACVKLDPEPMGRIGKYPIFTEHKVVVWSDDEPHAQEIVSRLLDVT